MPVIDTPTHESTRIGAEYRYGCHNKPRPVTGQSVYSLPKAYKYRFSEECRYDMSLTDSACAGCEWRGSGERYADNVRREA